MTNQRGMMDNGDQAKACGCNKCGKCISWSAILVGAFVGLGLSFLLNLFSIAIGLVAYKTTGDGAVFVIGGYLGLVIGAVVAYFFAGWSAGHLGFPHCAKDRGTFYGFTTWVVSGVLGMMLADHMGHYASYRTNLLSNPSASYVTVVDVPASASSSSSSTSTDSSATSTASTDKAATNGLMTVAFASFFLFLIAALSSILGAHCAYRCRFKQNNCKM